MDSASAAANIETGLRRALAEYVAADHEHLRARVARLRLRAPGACLLVYMSRGRVHTCVCVAGQSAADLALFVCADVYVTVRAPDDDELDAPD